MSRVLFRPLFRPLSRPPPFPRRFTSPAPTPTPTPPPAAAAAPSLSQRLKTLSKEYGYSALGVYLALSALDFPFCFLAVRHLGAERIGRWEDAAVAVAKPYWTGVRQAAGFPAAPEAAAAAPSHDWEAAEKNASVWTELALAYAVHKSFIFVRVPLTAAVTPKVVKVLRGWGWNIGRKGKPKISLPGGKDV